MATIRAIAHVSSSSPCNATFSSRSGRVRCASSPSSSFPQHKHEISRRPLSVALLVLNLLSLPKNAIADVMFDKYVKRKKLEPLELYLPAVLLTQSQFKDLKRVLEAEQPQYTACRSLLRSGPASSLRVNIRAVAQYASDRGEGSAASSDVDQCLRALEDLDSLLLQASRNNPKASVETMKAKIAVALGALDSLLETVPSAVLDKAKAIADAYNTQDDRGPENIDPEMQRLESIL